MSTNGTNPKIYFGSNEKYGAHRCFSNFYGSRFIYRGSVYSSVEHAFQAQKPEEHERAQAVAIKDAPTPAKARELGRKCTLRPDWDKVKLKIMEEILRCKFTQDLAARSVLRLSYPCQLIEKAPWDSFWGDGKDGQGKNMLGKLLMKIREDIIKGTQNG